MVKTGQKVKKGDLLIDGPASENGELALGQNLLIAYTSLDGLGYEDGLLFPTDWLRKIFCLRFTLKNMKRQWSKPN